MATLTNLVIHRFRGVQELSIPVKGKSIAIIGPNGSGKSSVADAIDFLLTGQVRRLTGEGAGSLSLGKHGPHVDAGPADAWVEGEFTSTTGGARVTLRRKVANPDQLDSDGPLPDDVNRLVAIARTGHHHMLTRREILSYIFTEPAKRGDQVAALLQLTQLDTIRKAIQAAAKAAADDLRQKTAVVDTRLKSVLRSVNPPAADWGGAHDRVNMYRKTFGGPPLDTLDTPTIRAGLTAPADAAAHPLQAQRTRELLGQALQWFEEGTAVFVTRVGAYLDDVEAVHRDTAALKSLQASELLRTGLVLVQENECPLCLREWEQGELRQLLQSRLEEAREAEASLKQLRITRGDLSAMITSSATAVRSLGDAIRTIDASGAAQCDAFAAALDAARAVLLPDPVHGTPPMSTTRQSALVALAPEDMSRALSEIRTNARALPTLAGAQQAWDELTGMENALREHMEAVKERQQAERIAHELAAADKLFLDSRDEVLQSIYDAIAGRFEALYATVHSEDESSFRASLSPTKAGLKLEVDFYDRGTYPPCALHSEGHQDSMGLCLFLTLTEYLAHGPMPLLILDDVLMSVDRGHRRAVAELLKKEFAGCQFIITTHDRVWWRQLRTLGLVPASGAIEFKGWSLANGPLVTADAGKMMGDAEAALAAGNVPGAAHALRRAVETYLPDICDALGATVRYRGDGAWEAGDFLSAAIGRYGDLLGEARAAANSWGDKNPAWEEINQRRKTVVAQFNAETWAINPNVHYNEWAEFEPADFEPVITAYKALFDLFICPQCGACIRIIEEGKEVTAVRCDCTQTNWNLVAKKKEEMKK